MLLGRDMAKEAEGKQSRASVVRHNVADESANWSTTDYEIERASEDERQLMLDVREGLRRE
jgi:hypothetical protein